MSSLVSRHWLTTTLVTNISMKSQSLLVWGKMLAQTRRYVTLRYISTEALTTPQTTYSSHWRYMPDTRKRFSHFKLTNFYSCTKHSSDDSLEHLSGQTLFADTTTSKLSSLPEGADIITAQIFTPRSHHQCVLSCGQESHLVSQLAIHFYPPTYPVN